MKPILPLIVKFGSRLAMADADIRAGRAQLLFRGANVRPLLDQLRRQADRQVSRQMQIGKTERLDRPLIGEDAGQCGQHIALLRQRLAQRRQRRPRLRQ